MLPSKIVVVKLNWSIGKHFEIISQEVAIFFHFYLKMR
jgi:hypothetical protein